MKRPACVLATLGGLILGLGGCEREDKTPKFETPPRLLTPEEVANVKVGAAGAGPVKPPPKAKDTSAAPTKPAAAKDTSPAPPKPTAP